MLVFQVYTRKAEVLNMQDGTDFDPNDVEILENVVRRLSMWHRSMHEYMHTQAHNRVFHKNSGHTVSLFFYQSSTRKYVCVCV